MRIRTFVLAAALSAGLISTGDAFAPRRGAERPIVTNGRAPRVARTIGWSTLGQGPLAGWRVQWDRDTNVPLRMWGPAIAAPGANANPAAAEAAARAFIAAHLDLLAPGATPADFELVANTVNPAGDLRTVAFAQRSHGLAVVGGSIGVAFKRDHLMLVSSTALPNIAVALPPGALPHTTLDSSAIRWLGQAGHLVVARGHGARVVLPIVRQRGRSATPDIDYRVAETVAVEATDEVGRWDVWLDAADATPIARHSTIDFATGTVNFNVPDRYPLSTRGPKPAPFLDATVDGTAATTAMDGTITWNTAGAGTVVPSLAGTFAAITNQAGALVTTTLTIAVGGSATWDESGNEQADAQLDAYVYENTVKHFVLTQVNPNLTWAMGQISVNVNENPPMETCNAYSTGDDIHFFIAQPAMCENTGRIADVVYHETGHSVHFNSIIPGQGQFDTSLSEGLADTLAVSVTGDPGLGRGFFLNDMPLRDLNPAVKKVYPQDYDGEPHDDGEIIGETLWDTRQALQTKLGVAAGFAQFIKIYYGIVQRSPDIPSSFPEALAADDDDGDLSNGTPNMCEIQAAFAAHGLADAAFTLGLKPPTRDNYTVGFTVTAPADAQCATATVTSAALAWDVRGGAGSGTLDLVATGNSWSTQIPTQPDNTVVEYSVAITLSDGSMVVYPDNKADPKYQFYVGGVTPIKCWDFEQGASDWTHSGTPAANDEWAAGPPLGIGGDPMAAHGGSNVFGIDLGADDGDYSASTMQYAQSPEVAIPAGVTSVRLQYWRWLGVEDGVYDQGTIFANGTKVWSNFASQGDPEAAEINHVDKEWRFQDVDLSAQAASGKIQLKFEVDSDQEVELGGWTLDDVCIVAVGANAAVCGNGVVDAGEQCDDGNTTDGDGCSSTCQSETGSDGPGAKSGGCCSVGGDPVGAMALSLMIGALVLRRRRR